MESRGKMSQVKAELKWKQKVEIGYKMRKFKLKNFRIPNPYLKCGSKMWEGKAKYGKWKQNGESGIKMGKVESKCGKWRKNGKSGGKWGKWNQNVKSGSKMCKVEVNCVKWKQNVESGTKCGKWKQ